MRLMVFDFEVTKYNWLIVYSEIKSDGEPFTWKSIWDDREALAELYHDYEEDTIWIAFNAMYDWAIFKSILADINPHQTSQLIIEKRIQPSQLFKHPDYKRFPNDYPLKIFDVRSESVSAQNFSLSLKRAEGYMGEAIVESTVAFDIDRKLTDDEKTEMLEYCVIDVQNTRKIFLDHDIVKNDLRVKLEMFELVLRTPAVKHLSLEKVLRYKTSTLCALILSGKGKVPVKMGERITFAPNMQVKHERVWEFFRNIEFTEDNKMPELENLTLNMCGLEITLGKGGIHGAKKSCKIVNEPGKTNTRIIDAGGYYPSIMILYNLLSRAIPDSNIYVEWYELRKRLKLAGDAAQEIYKRATNIVFGDAANQYSAICDLLHAISTTAYGQLFMIDLMEKLYDAKVCEIIQINTDGLVIDLYEGEDNLRKYETILQEWMDRTKFTLDSKVIQKLFQKDVNNYVMQLDNGQIKVKGAATKQYGRPAFYKNDLYVITKALVDYLINGVKIEKTFDEAKLIDFQYIAHVTGGSPKFRQLAIQHRDLGVNLLALKNNRIFPTIPLVESGKLMKVKENGYDKYPNLPEDVIVLNTKINDGEYETYKNIINYEWFKNQIVELITDFGGQYEEN